MMDLGAQALGCAVFPAGVGQTEMQVAAIADLKPHAYAGTPSFLKIILEKADELKRGCVEPEARPWSPARRCCRRCASWLEARGIDVRQSYGTADLGLVAYETIPDGGD